MPKNHAVASGVVTWVLLHFMPMRASRAPLGPWVLDVLRLRGSVVVDDDLAATRNSYFRCSQTDFRPSEILPQKPQEARDSDSWAKRKA